MLPFSLILLSAVAPAQVGSIDMSSSLIEVSGVGHQRTIPCEGRAVDVAGSGHVLTFTGTCAGLTLSGTDNQVTINLAPNAPLTVDGSEQVVRWRSSSPPRQSVSGVGNRVSRLRD
ncbi:DUF3060 domain-containing protein [Brevundimonas faecalis]|uniref:DUF3060 domain-containing protein n=1 Tax=Brevundimonas faecalis TaxID=947378 RepID=A0ABV2RAX9_9CAUL